MSMAFGPYSFPNSTLEWVKMEQTLFRGSEGRGKNNDNFYYNRNTMIEMQHIPIKWGLIKKKKSYNTKKLHTGDYELLYYIFIYLLYSTEYNTRIIYWFQCSYFPPPIRYKYYLFFRAPSRHKVLVNFFTLGLIQHTADNDDVRFGVLHYWIHAINAQITIFYR